MSRHVKTPVYGFMVCFVTVIMLSGCIVHVGANSGSAEFEFDSDYSSVNKSLTISSGKHVGDASSVNGRLTIEDDVVAEDISSVNGSLKIGKNVRADEVSTVNGKLRADENLFVKGDVSSVNGSISLSSDSTVEGNVETVNGRIGLDSVMVQENIETVNGSIYLSGKTVVEGDIIYAENNNNRQYKGRYPELKVDEDVRITGNIILYRPVDLFLENKDLEDKLIKKY